MKKFLISLFALSLAVQAFCAPVDQSKAAAKAKEFFRVSGKSAVMSSPTLAKASSTQNPTWFVYNNPSGGFVILSGDDAAPAVLAYSREGSFDASDIPANLQWWLDNVDAQVRDLRASGAAASSSWSKVLDATPVKKYETAEWGQESPYNKYCPQFEGEEDPALVGSVATAAAIICRYHQWPLQGNGTTPGYSYTSQETSTSRSISANDLGTYDYTLMPLTGDSEWTTEQKNAVAKLSYDLGTAVKTKYGNVSSDAPVEMLVSAMVNYMSYSKTAKAVYKASYTDSDWMTLLKGNLNAEKPVIYFGEDATTGVSQAFVLDGYDSEDYFSVNWGDCGEGNGYYLLTNLKPGTSTFSKGQRAITGLFKSDISVYSDYLILRSGDGYNGLSADTTSFSKGQTFTMKMGQLQNLAPKAFTGTVYLTLYDKNGEQKEDIATVEVISDLANYYESGEMASKKYASISCKITGETVPGDVIKARYVGQYSSDVIVNADEDCVCYIVNQVSKEKLAAGTSISYSKTNAAFTFHCTYDTTVNIRNTDGQIAATSSAVAGEDCVLSLRGVAAGEHILEVVSGTTVYSINFTL